MLKNPIFYFLFLLLFLFYFKSKGQSQVSYTDLQIDSNYCQINFYDLETAKSFYKKFEDVKSKKLTIFHFGGSHIQAEIPSTRARENFTATFGNGGRGMIFAYTAAKTYSSINYDVTHSENWQYGKSFQFPPKIPLGVCGMAVQNSERNSFLLFEFKKPIEDNKYKLKILTDIDSLTPTFSVWIDSTVFEFRHEDLIKQSEKNYLELTYSGKINKINIIISDSVTNNLNFRFYGIDVELDKPNGVVYHSLGVGAAPFRSVLNISKLEEHSAILKPDIVLLDFGTNDILYKNAIDDNLINEVESTIARFRKINPEIIIILTSTQDLVYKRKAITACIDFRNLMDSIACKNKCMFWNWYDLSGGIGTIRNWHSLHYAQKDFIHLTMNGYKVKGQLLYESFMKTLNAIKSNSNLDKYVVPLKQYEYVEQKIKSKEKSKKDKTINQDKGETKTNNKTYKVKKGDTLSGIARKHNLSVEKLKKLNNITSDKLSIGKTLRVK